jgi:transposase
MVYHDNSTRAAVVVLKAIGKPNHEITGLTGVEKRTINSIYARAIERGFDPGLRPLQLEDKHLEDAHRPGRPSKQSTVSQQVVDTVRTDRYGREKSCADIAGLLSQQGFSVSASTVSRVLREEGFRKTKPTRKPGLTKQMREERYRWCQEHADWTLEDWKNVIWSDETSVVLNHRRGGYRIWRRADEAFLRSCIRERWKGYSEFMFWGCFSYDKKGPCHCWTPETNKEKEAASAWIDELNEKLEPIKKAEWELENGIRRLNLRNKPGRRPQWKWNTKTGKLSRRDGSGIDWYRYQTIILLPKLIPFAKECKADRPRTVVQEDKAPSHDHYVQSYIYSLHDVKKILWCGNSPDLNAIEPCWPWMKRATTKRGAPKNRVEGIQAWEQCWKDLPQEKIQAWIERIPYHIKQIIELKGGNEYKEGRRLRKPEPELSENVSNRE